MGKPRKSPRPNDLTSRYLSGELQDDESEQAQQRFTARSKHSTQNKILKTFLMRAEEAAAAGDVETLPVGLVVQVFSLFSEVEHEARTHLCVVRKTLTRVSDTALVVGDRVKFRVIMTPQPDAPAATREPEAVIEEILPRQSVLTRAESFRGTAQHPIVANADQMLIVASLRHPTVKWGLIDRMIVSAWSGALKPIICLNKIDLAAGDPPDGPDADDEENEEDEDAPEDAEAIANEAAAQRQRDDDLAFAREVLTHYESLGVPSLQTSAESRAGLDALREALLGKTTVLAGHSGVGKSSLIRAIQPQLDLRIGEVSRYTDKGRHTTTSARRYPLDFGGAVIDTPGIKHFGLWGITADNLIDHFPDLAADTAPAWRRESYERILQSLGERP